MGKTLEKHWEHAGTPIREVKLRTLDTVQERTLEPVPGTEGVETAKYAGVCAGDSQRSCLPTYMFLP
jgi:hypothetical protein